MLLFPILMCCQRGVPRESSLGSRGECPPSPTSLVLCYRCSPELTCSLGELSTLTFVCGSQWAVVFFWSFCWGVSLCETRFACLSRRQWASVLTVPKQGVSFRQWCLTLFWLRVVPFFPLSKCNSVFCWFLPEMGIFIHSFPTQSNGQLFLLCLLLSYLTTVSPGLCCRHSRARSRDRLGEVQKKINTHVGRNTGVCVVRLWFQQLKTCLRESAESFQLPKMLLEKIFNEADLN